MPKHIEIERKFILNAIPKEAVDFAEQNIIVRQGYFGNEKYEVRIRQEDWDSKGSSYFLTHKDGIGLSRVENEMQITKEMYDVLFPLCGENHITKIRHLCLIPGCKQVWEIDVFTNRNLILAEVELEHENEEVYIPPQIEQYVIDEVTGIKEYTNSYIARNLEKR